MKIGDRCRRRRDTSGLEGMKETSVGSFLSSSLSTSNSLGLYKVLGWRSTRKSKIPSKIQSHPISIVSIIVYFFFTFFHSNFEPILLLLLLFVHQTKSKKKEMEMKEMEIKKIIEDKRCSPSFNYLAVVRSSTRFTISSLLVSMFLIYDLNAIYRQHGMIKLPDTTRIQAKYRHCTSSSYVKTGDTKYKSRECTSILSPLGSISRW